MKPCILYCWSKVDPLEYLENFLESIKKYCQDECQNVPIYILCKNGNNDEFLEKTISIVLRFQLKNVVVVPRPSIGYDVGTFIEATQNLNYDIFIWLTASSEVSRATWLSELLTPFHSNNVALVGSMASHESLSCNLLERFNRSARSRLASFIRERLTIIPEPTTHWFAKTLAPFFVIVFCFLKPKLFFRYKLIFPGFPNPHVRTTGIAVRKSFLMKSINRSFLDKLDTLGFESGKNSITRTSLNSGMDVLVAYSGGTITLDNDLVRNTFRSLNSYIPPVTDRHFRSFLQLSKPEQGYLIRRSWGFDL